MAHKIAKALSLFVLISLTACRLTDPPRAVDWPARRDAALATARQQEPDVGVVMLSIRGFPLGDQNKHVALMFHFLQPDGTGRCFASSGTSLDMEPSTFCVSSKMTAEDRSYSRQQFVQATVSPETALHQALLEAQPFIAKYQPNVAIGGALHILPLTWLRDHPDNPSRIFWRISFLTSHAEKQVSIDAVTGSIVETKEIMYP